MTAPTYDVVEYRFVADDGTESGSSFLAGLDIDIDRPPTSAYRFRIRFQIENTNSKTGSESFDLEYNKLGGGWNPVDDSASSNIRAIVSAFSTPPSDGDDTTNRLTSRGGSFDGTNNGWSNTGVGTSDTFSASNYWEVEYCIYIIDADTALGNTIQLRVVEGSGDPTTMLSTPTVTVAGAASDNQAAYIGGTDTASDNKSAYIKGALAASDSKSAYMLGTVCPVIDIQSSAGSIKTCYAVNSYARIIANATSKSAIETLIKFTFDNTTAKSTFRTFIRGSNDWDSNVTPTQAYELAIPNDGGYQVNRITTGSRTAIGGAGSRTADTGDWWLRFRAEGTQIKVKVWTGAEPAAWDKDIDDSGSGFSTAGVFQLAMETTTGGVEHTVTLDDISYHGPEVSDSSSAYISGSSGGTPASDRQPAYVAGSQAASDASSAYIAGTADASDSQSAYIDALDYFPFTEDFSEGNTGDPWRIAYWATDTV